MLHILFIKIIIMCVIPQAPSSIRGLFVLPVSLPCTQTLRLDFAFPDLWHGSAHEPVHLKRVEIELIASFEHYQWRALRSIGICNLTTVIWPWSFNFPINTNYVFIVTLKFVITIKHLCIEKSCSLLISYWELCVVLFPVLCDLVSQLRGATPTPLKDRSAGRLKYTYKLVP